MESVFSLSTASILSEITEKVYDIKSKWSRTERDEITTRIRNKKGVQNIIFEGCVTVHLPHEIIWNANLMQQGNFINILMYIRHNIIKQKMNVTRSLLEDIKTKLKWYGHVQRMEEGRLPKKVMKWSPPGRRKRGRPKLTWAEEIRGLMEGKGLMEEDWNDREKWKKKII